MDAIEDHMHSVSDDDVATEESGFEQSQLSIHDFPKPSKQHILNCSYSAWHQNYKSISPKVRIIPLPNQFIEYLREDGVYLPIEENEKQRSSEEDDEDKDQDDEEEEYIDPLIKIGPIHALLKSTIAELGGKVTPKLNWSAPKDSTHFLNNSLKCYTPNDVYLLLKTSDFITHDLEYAFDDTLENDSTLAKDDIKYDLVVRKWVDFITSVEFRCFVKDRKLVGITQRDMNHYEFLHKQRDDLHDLIQDFFDENLQQSFPDSNFTFDVYIPKSNQSASRVWLIDMNPYAPRTDPLLFSWTEILNINPASTNFKPEFRLINANDPEAYNFSTAKYSAHKLPKEVFEAGSAGIGPLQEFAGQWKDIIARMEGKGETEDSSSDDSSEEEEEEEDKDEDKVEHKEGEGHASNSH